MKISADKFLMARYNSKTILPNGMEVDFNARGKQNDNIAVIGGTGTMKTTGAVEPILSTGGSSFVISDPKGILADKYRTKLENLNYKVIELDFINPEKSAHYNPLDYVETPNDVQKISRQIVALSDGYKTNDSFWPKSSELLANAVIGFLEETQSTVYSKSISGISQVLSLFDTNAIEEGRPCKANLLFEDHNNWYKRKYGHDSWAYQQFRKFMGVSSRTNGCVLLTLQGNISSLDTEKMKKMMNTQKSSRRWKEIFMPKNDLDIRDIGLEKTAVFIKVSDTDRSKDLAVNLFYSQAIDQLCRLADMRSTHSLPVPVRFILDDFGTSAKIEGFDKMISNIRSRGISVMIVLQSIAQLREGYGESAQTIFDNCDTTIYMGGNNPDTAEYFGRIVDKPLKQILRMPIGTNWIIRRGEEPVYGETIPIYNYEEEKIIRYDLDDELEL